jgi:hypothetical protein
VSTESQEIFNRALHGGAGADELRAAAAEHLNCSRPLEKLTELYAVAMEAGDHAAAQELAAELVPVRAAGRVVAAVLPEASDGVD